MDPEHFTGNVSFVLMDVLLESESAYVRNTERGSTLQCEPSSHGLSEDSSALRFPSALWALRATGKC